LLDLVAERMRAHPATDVAGAAVAKIHGVHHAVAVEPVIQPFWLQHRIRAVAHVGAAQIRRDFAGRHAQIDGGDLGNDRRVRAMQVRVVDAVHPGRAVGGIDGRCFAIGSHRYSDNTRWPML
jgi:hypothetical protein